MKIAPLYSYKFNFNAFKNSFKGSQHATNNDSRLDFYQPFPLGSVKNDITKIDSKILIGRAPGSPRYIQPDGYQFDFQTLKQDLYFLKNNYVDTIVDLRNPKYEGSECSRVEAEVCREIGLKYVNIPLDSAITPTDEELNTFFGALNDSDKGKRAYIHCHAGKDRTGIMTSFWLAKEHKMSAEEAFQTVFDNRLDYQKGNSTPIKRLKFMNTEHHRHQIGILCDKLEKVRSGELKF